VHPTAWPVRFYAPERVKGMRGRWKLFAVGGIRGLLEELLSESGVISHVEDGFRLMPITVSRGALKRLIKS